MLSVCLLTAQTCLNPSYKLQKLKSRGITKDSIDHWISKELSFLQLTNHDTIADVGSYNGYYPALYSVFTDSLVFYLNDVVPEGFAYFDSIQEVCTNIRGTKMTNEFKIMMGTQDSTGLPSARFDKVILRDALHHFKSPSLMLKDLKRILKPDACLLLFEPIKHPEVLNTSLCRGSMTRDEFLALMKKQGFSLSREKNMGNDRYWFEFKLVR